MDHIWVLKAVHIKSSHFQETPNDVQVLRNALQTHLVCIWNFLKACVWSNLQNNLTYEMNWNVIDFKVREAEKAIMGLKVHQDGFKPVNSLSGGVR